MLAPTPDSEINPEFSIENDRVRKLIRDRVQELRMSYAEVSRQVGRNPSYIWQYLMERRVKHLPEKVRRQVADVLGIPDYVLDPEWDGVSVPQDAPDAAIPVYSDLADINLSTTHEWTTRPSGASNVVFGVWVTIPRGRLQSGDLAFVARQAPRTGDTVLIVDGMKMIGGGFYLGATDKGFTVDVGGKKVSYDHDMKCYKVVHVTFP